MIMRKCGRRLLMALPILLCAVALSCSPRMPGTGMYDEGWAGPVVTPEGVFFCSDPLFLEGHVVRK